MSENAAFYSDAFYAAVDDAFRRTRPPSKLAAEAGGDEDPTATKDKKRIRDKIRAAATTLRITNDGHGEDVADVMRRLATDALDRLAQAEAPWIASVDWKSIFATFAQEAWPGLSPPARLLRAAEDAVFQWREVRYGAAQVEEVERVIEQFRPGMRLGVQLRDLRVVAYMPGYVGDLVLEVGDTIASVDGTRVCTQDDVVAALAAAQPGPLRLSVVPAQQGYGSTRGEVERIITDLPVGAKLGVLWRGLCVDQLAPVSAAVGILAVGDVVISVQGRQVYTLEELMQFIDAARPGPVRLGVLPVDASPVAQAPPTPRAPPPRPPAPRVTPSMVPQFARRPTRPAQRNAALISESAEEQRRKLPPAEVLAASHASEPVAVQRQFLPTEVQRQIPPAEVSAARLGRVVVVNCEDVARTATRGQGAQRGGPRPSAWLAVGRVAEYLQHLGVDVQLVVGRCAALRGAPPDNLRPMIVRCPVVDVGGEAGEHTRDQTPVRVFVLRLAQEHACQWVDNYNYRADAWSGHASWEWLQGVGLALKVHFMFDPFGTFVPLENIDAAAAAACA